MPLHFFRAPFVAISGGLCGGILLYFRAGVTVEAGIVILIAGAILFWLLERRPLPYGWRYLYWLPLIICSLAVGVGTASLHPRLMPEAIPGGAIARGVVTDTATTSFGHRLEVRLTGLKEIEGGKAFLYTDTPAAPGDIVSFPANFAEPTGAPDSRGWLFSRGIDLVSYPAEVVVSGP